MICIMVSCVLFSFFLSSRLSASAVSWPIFGLPRIASIVFTFTFQLCFSFPKPTYQHNQTFTLSLWPSLTPTSHPSSRAVAHTTLHHTAQYPFPTSNHTPYQSFSLHFSFPSPPSLHYSIPVTPVDNHLYHNRQNSYHAIFLCTSQPSSNNIHPSFPTSS